jgi:hypothetical protein
MQRRLHIQPVWIYTKKPARKRERSRIVYALLAIAVIASGLLWRSGLYHLPRYDPVLGVLGPSYHAMQDLIQRKAGGNVFPTGASAANVLGLCDQVPMRSWYLTTGPSRRIRNGKSEIVLRHVSPRFVSTKNPKSAQVIIALRWLGKRAVDDDVISRLHRNLSPSDRAGLLADAGCAPAWIADIFRNLAKDSTAD